jgi:hypothetical protein
MQEVTMLESRFFKDNSVDIKSLVEEMGSEKNQNFRKTMDVIVAGMPTKMSDEQLFALAAVSFIMYDIGLTAPK